MKILLKKLFNNLWLLPVFLTLLLVFLKISLGGLDPDLGWHLRIAKDFLEKGIFPSTDRFSFALNNFPWVEFEFRLEEVMYLIYRTVGYFGLALTFSLLTASLVTAHIWLTVKVFKVRVLTTLLFSGIFILGLFSSFGIRVPVVSVWLNIVLFWLTYFYLKDKVKLPILLFVTSGLFFIWANVHPSFPFGLLTLGLAVVVKSHLKRKVDLQGVVTLIVSTVVTIFNPYGLRLWLEVLGHFGPQSSYMHTYIQEWRPLFLVFPLEIYGLCAFWFIFLITIQGQKLLFKDFPFQLVMIIFYFVSTIFAVRNLGLLMIWSLPPLLIVIDSVVKINIPVDTRQKNFGYLFLSVLLMLMVAKVVVINLNTNYLTIPPKNYPSSEAVAAIVKNLPSNTRLYNPYQWGGYLIWNFDGNPQTFIDGRMPATWYQGNVFPFKDYTLLSKNDDSLKKQVFDKYGFNIAVVEKNKWTPLNWLNRLIIGGEGEERKRAQEVEAAAVRTWLAKQPGWKIVYSDETAEVFIRT